MQTQSPLSVLKHRNFRIYWIGQAVSLVGTWMQTMALGVVVTRLTAEATVLSAQNIVGSIPVLLLSLVGGSLADRLDKRRILLVTQALMMALAFAFAMLLHFGQITMWHLFGFAFLLGIAMAFDLPASQSLPAELVDVAEIPRAVALMQSIFHGSRLIGPALAGLLIAQLGAESAFVVNGLSFLTVIGSLLLIRPRNPAQDRRKPQGGGGILAGLQYVASEPLLRSLITLSALTTFFIFPFVAVLMIYFSTYVLHASDQWKGLLMACSGLGSLIGSLSLVFASDSPGRKRILMGLSGSGVAMMLLSLLRSPSLAAPVVVLLTFSMSSLMGTVSQIVQKQVPGELRGRVMGVYSISFSGVMPFSTLLISFLSDHLSRRTQPGAGFPVMMKVASVAYVFSGLAVLFSADEAFARLETPASPAASPASKTP
jgi:MFS family permease